MVIFLSAIGTLILVAGVIGTILLSRDKEADYSSSTKGNMTRLILIYLVLLVASGIGIWLYVKYFSA
ncbi:hypothetical protein ACOI1C_04490 [Bacillus sp. DJP31]|uniref:hypothetical protein n=1 Tax=Bacillus sp. DJP31 TaxID=3409789 RepID=UPI003BB6AFEB